MVARIYRQSSTWPQRSGGNGYMGISMHSRSHTGEGLRHMIEWINEKSCFGFIRIGVSDTLNRFNYMVDEKLNEEQAHKKALAIGDAWLDMNSGILASLTLPHEIIRWDHWEKTYPANVSRNRRTYLEAFRTIPEFRMAMLQDIENFTLRSYGTTPNKTDFETTKKCVNYLIEELAVYEEIYRNYPNTTIYPAKQLHVIELLRSGFMGLSETFPLSRFERLYIPVDVAKDAKTTASIRATG